MLKTRWRLCIVIGIVLLLLTIFSPGETASQVRGANSTRIFAIVLLVIGYVLRRWSRKRPSNTAVTMNDVETQDKKTTPAKRDEKIAYVPTKVCHSCCATIPFAATICEYCEVVQKKDDSTCGAGTSSPSEARSDFAKARNQAKRVDSKYYIWRTSRDGAVCERCRANNGKKFSWDNEPQGGHAGANARCRCYPEPVIPGCSVNTVGKSQWEKSQESDGVQHLQKAEEFLDLLRSMLAEKIDKDRLQLRYFWAKYYVLLDNDVKKPVVALELNRSDEQHVIFFAEPDQNVKDGGSRRTKIQFLEDINKYSEKIRRTLDKY